MTTTARRRPPPRRGPGARPRARRGRLDWWAARALGSQEELAGLLRTRFAVPQATGDRDIAELGLVKAPRGDRHAYVTPRTLAGEAGAVHEPGGGPVAAAAGVPQATDARLLRILADSPVTIARSGLTLVLVSRPGSASAIGQAIDESPLDDEVGTLAGDNTLLVLFADEPALERWRARFSAIAAQAAAGLPESDLTSTYP